MHPGVVPDAGRKCTGLYSVSMLITIINNHNNTDFNNTQLTRRVARRSAEGDAPPPALQGSSDPQPRCTYAVRCHRNMYVCARLLLLAALPALVGRAGWCADGEVVSVTEAGAGGAGPAFAPRQRAAVVAAVGQAAALDCRVLRLGDKSVSWVRSRDLQILAHAGAVFTADSRVSATSGAAGAAGGASRHTLRVERLRVADGGRYECQVNTEPKMSLFFNLTVIDEPVPAVVVSALGATRVGVVAGASATLACEARYEPQPQQLPLAPIDIRWRKGKRFIDPQSSPGGVSLETERWGWRAVSRLTLARVAAADAGAYACAAGPANATLHLRLLEPDREGPMEAMQRDETGVGAGAGARLAAERWRPLLAQLLVLLLLRLLAT
ncbi:hypothetical protein K1T71_009059 [Dendrolimus kikuchii]|uniref:Uncharacterized protein n=1 Tax=Dendrolimus kikuchii TaxID=765133 RepID=A0ACC1CTD9_9NEOP|nr:hypothetical protein K1T71_009059 [Dendrolimus kikuchii]